VFAYGSVSRHSDLSCTGAWQVGCKGVVGLCGAVQGRGFPAGLSATGKVVRGEGGGAAEGGALMRPSKKGGGARTAIAPSHPTVYPPDVANQTRTLPCVWNLATAAFVTSNPVKALAEIAALLLLARVIEPIYGSTEFLRLLLTVAVSSSAAVFVGVYLLYLVSPDKDGKVL